MGIESSTAGLVMGVAGAGVAISGMFSDTGTPADFAGQLGPPSARALFGGMAAATGAGLYAGTFLMFTFLAFTFLTFWKKE